MRKAFVLISTDLGTETVLQKELTKVEGVVGVYQVFGAYDMVAVVEAESEEELKHIIFSRIRTLNYLKSTITLNVVSLSKRSPRAEGLASASVRSSARNGSKCAKRRWRLANLLRSRKALSRAISMSGPKSFRTLTLLHRLQPVPEHL